MENNENDQKTQNTWVKYSQIGLQMILIIVAGAFLGHWLDGKFPSKLPIYTLCFSLFSIATAMYLVIKQLPKQ